MITIRVTPNLLEQRGNDSIEAEWVPGKTLAEYRPDGAAENVIWNGQVVSGEDLGQLVPEDQAFLIFTPEVELPFVAVGAQLFITGLAAAGTLTGTQALVALAVLSVVSLGLGLLMASTGTGGDQDSINGFGAVGDTVEAGTTIPLTYGIHRIGGQLLDWHTKAKPDGGNRAWMLWGLGEGRIEALSGETGGEAGEIDNAYRAHAATADIEIDGNPFSDYKGARVFFRAGEIMQSGIPGFRLARSVNPVGLVLDQPTSGGKISNGPGPWFSKTTSGPVDEVICKFSCPSGLYWSTPKGKIRSQQVHFDLRYRGVGAQTWTYIRDIAVPPETETLTETTDETLGLTPQFVRKSLSPVFLDLPLEFTARDTYEVEIRRVNIWRYAFTENQGATHGFIPEPDAWRERLDNDSRHEPPHHFSELRWDALEEIVDEKLAYPGIALVGLKAVATEQLNGFVPRVTFKVKGRRVKVWDGVDEDNPVFSTVWTQNPAWIALDVLTDEVAGLGHMITVADVDLPAFKVWADFCDELVSDGNGGTEPRCQFDGAFDQQNDGWRLFLHICSTARASAVLWGTKISIKIERARPRSQVFSTANIIKDSFSRTWINRRDKPNAILAQFRNAAINYEMDAVQVESNSVIEDAEPMRKKTASLIGIARESQALREAKHMLAMLENIDEEVSFDIGFAAIGAGPGERIGISRDLPEWSVSGRVAGPGSGTATITLDQDVTVGVGTYRILVTHKDGSTEELSVSSPAGDYAAGDEITMVSDWALAPEEDDTYALGEILKLIRDYVLSEVTTDPDFVSTVKAYKYAGDAVFAEADNVLIVPFPDDKFPTAETIPSDVTGVRLREATFIDEDGHSVLALEAFWAWGDTAAPQLAGVYYRELGSSEWQSAGQTTGQSLMIREGLGRRDVIEVAVVATGPGGGHKDPDDAPRTTILLTGLSPVPLIPTGLTAARVGDAIELRWDPPALDVDGEPTNLSVLHYEARRGSSWRMGLPVGASASTRLTILDFLPASEPIQVRAVDRVGQTSPGSATVMLNPAPPLGAAIQHEQADHLLGWPGSKIGVEVGSFGEIHLVSGLTQGQYISPALDLGEAKTWQLALGYDIAQRQAGFTLGTKKLAIGAVTGTGFVVGETVGGQTSLATGRVLAAAIDGDAAVYIEELTGTFVSGEVIAGVTSASTATTSAAPTGLAWDDTELTRRDFGGPFSERHLASAPTSPNPLSSAVALQTSIDGLNFAVHSGATQAAIECRYVQLEVILATDDATNWPPMLTRLHLIAYDALRPVEGLKTTQLDKSMRMRPDGIGGVVWAAA